MSDETNVVVFPAPAPASVPAAVQSEITSVPTVTAPAVLPFGMRPPPARRRRVSPPIDLGQFDSNFEGWQVVFDLDIGLEAYEKLALARDAATGGVESLKLMREWMQDVLVAWNFPVADFDGGMSAMRQPRDGGVKDCPPAVLGAIAQAFGEAITPPKSDAG